MANFLAPNSSYSDFLKAFQVKDQNWITLLYLMPCVLQRFEGQGNVRGGLCDMSGRLARLENDVISRLSDMIKQFGRRTVHDRRRKMAQAILR